MKKKMIIDGQERFHEVKDHKNFSRLMDKLELFTIKFEEYDIMKPKKYLSGYSVIDEKYQPIIMITHGQCIFVTSNIV